MIFDWPVGTDEERSAATDRLPGGWQNSNPFDNHYEIAPGIWNWHDGVDLNLNTPTWNADWHKPLRAIADGVVTFAGVGGGSWGHIIDIRHTDTDGTFVVSRFGHIEAPLVKTGDRVKVGQQVASVGNGDNYYGQSGAHLHWNLSKTNDPIMLTMPNQWCGTSQTCVKVHYTDPIAFIIARKAQKAPVLYVTYGTGLDVYQTADHNSRVLAHVNYGDMVAVLPGPTVRGYVHIQEPVDGYVAEQWLRKDKPPRVLPMQTRYVNATPFLWVHSKPDSATTTRVGKLTFGTAVHVQLDDPANLVNNFARLADGAFAGRWAFDDFLQVEKPDPTPPPTVVVVPAASVKGFGPHILGNTPSPDKVYPIFKAVDNPGAVAAAHQRTPGGLYIHRCYNQQVDQVDAFVAGHGGAAQAAAAWYNMYKGDFESLPYALHEGPCEAFVSDALIAFEYERAKLLAANGYKACVLNLGTGHTSDDLWKRADVGRLLQLVQQSGGAVGLHCYGEAVISASSGRSYWTKDGNWSTPGEILPKTIDPAQSWLALRIVRDQQIARGLGFQVQFIATELGVDDCASGDANGIYRPHGIQTRGWRSCLDVWSGEGWLAGTDGGAFFLKQLQWWCDITGLPGCVYAHGDTDTFDTRGLL